MPSAYQPGIPTGLVFLDQDYANIQQNFQTLDTYFGSDHVPFSVATAAMPSGYHQDIHMVPVSTVTSNGPTNYVTATGLPVGLPAATPGFGQLFSAQVNDGIATDESLFYTSGGGRSLALTRNFTPTLVAASGASMLPGGLIINWGTVTTDSSGDATVTFTQKLPGTVFTAQCTVREGSSSSRNVKINNFTTQLGFVTKMTIHTSDKALDVLWMVIGN